MKKGRFLWSAHRITEKQKAGKARNIKGKQLKNSRNTASKPLFQLVEKVRFLFCTSCDSTHKMEFAQQIHKNRGRVPRFLYKGRKNVSGGRGFSSAFDRKRGFDREATKPLFFHLFCSFLCRLFFQLANPLIDIRRNFLERNTERNRKLAVKQFLGTFAVALIDLTDTASVPA